jgi:hypothetical protein
MCSEIPDFSRPSYATAPFFGSPPFASPDQALGVTLTKHVAKSKKVTETGQTSPQRAGL